MQIGPRNGEVRAVNYVSGHTTPKDAFGNEGDPIPLIAFRVEQFWDGTWAPIKVYFDGADGLVEQA